MINNDKNHLSVAYNTSIELIKEKLKNENNLFERKFKKFIIPKAVFTGEYLYKINLDCIDQSILNIGIEAIFSENVNFKLIVNKIIVYDGNIATLLINKNVIVNNLNEIDIIVKSESSVEINDFVINIDGNFKNVTKCDMFNLKSNALKMSLAKSINGEKYFSEYESIDQLINNFYKDLNKCSFGELLDYNFKIDSNGLKGNTVYLYRDENNELKLTDGVDSVKIVSSSVDSAALLSMNKTGCSFIVAYLLNGQINVVTINENFLIEKAFVFEHEINEKIIKIGGVDDVNSTLDALYFVTNNSNVYVSIVKTNSETVDFNRAYRIVRGDNCMMFLKDNILYVFTYYDNCLTLNKYKTNMLNDITNANKISSSKFYNCEYGFVFQNSIYVISEGNVTLIGEA